ncbi:MAG: rhodanese-like domain-containing protein [Legionellaceae bacterium]|nr:rhodanese-like domain-containing protein [Legionellaceae bacterium]
MKKHSPQFLHLVEMAKDNINEISTFDLNVLINKNEDFHLIDVREESEIATGRIHNAKHLSRGIIERDIEKAYPNLNEHIIVYCSGGFRGALVAQSLQQMGYTNIQSLSGGSSKWCNDGYKMED